MSENGFDWKFAFNGGSEDAVQLKLSTGQVIEITVKEALDDFAHLSAILMEQIFVPTFDRSTSHKKGLDESSRAVVAEIQRMVERLDRDEAKLLLKLILFWHFCQTHDFIINAIMQGLKKRKRKR